MPSPFRSRIRAALANPTLQAALDWNSERRLKARLQAMASIPINERENIRQRAREVRARVIAELDYYLEQFTSNARDNGLIVHQAIDGAHAVQEVLQIAHQHHARLIAKAKTMVGEEIWLNPALEADGLNVVETDLGEYIVQLRGEPPSHIISPAVHLTRQDVGVTFSEKLGVPYTDDIPTLTAIAHDVLRQTFLEADIGLSGVNLGVVESGMLCLVTNEGNGRMCTTLPKVHIALMGIERIVPTLDDLALVLQLLPRSATGQKLTVYTSLINRPRRSDEIDGPVERHLVLVDNGRRALQRSPLAEALYCIRCGACLNACPIFREIGGHNYVGVQGHHTPYPGPIGSVISPGLFRETAFNNLARASSLCGACKEICPVEIDFPKLLLRIRAGQWNREPAGETDEEQQEITASSGDQVDGTDRAIQKGKAELGGWDDSQPHVPTGLRVGLHAFTWIASSPWRFDIAQRLAGLFSHLINPLSDWLRMPALTGWGYRRDFPRPALSPFHTIYSKIRDNSLSTAQLTPLPPNPHTARGDELLPTSPPTVDDDHLPLVERFKVELAALGGMIVCCSSEELSQHLLDLLHKLDVSTIQAWEETQLPEGLLAALGKNGVQIQQDPDPSIRVGLTGALAGIAETGSIILTSGAGRPLTASLLPEIHCAVLRKEDIRRSLAETLNLPQVRQASSAVIITGPSRTADIEMALTIGVHGPREIHVLVV